MNTNREKVSYCIGLEAGLNLKNQFKDIDLRLLSEGFQDALDEKEPQLSREEIDSIMTALQQQIQMQQRAFITQVSEDNKKAGEEFLENNKKRPEVVTLPSGLQYRVISSGNGPTPTMLDIVSCHYRGYFIDGKVFDSSYERGQPQEFPMNRVIPGWIEALRKMKVGDKWEIFIPHYLAYGEAGYGPYIQPNTTLIFEMQLLGINNK